ncbi:hypothetical protein B0A49_12230 [Cryomyces minteri]|uniref:Uncharacterized protein n=1 Tax=Cryomyces minteri TaxID=331657 RepID=A0A4U0VM91_9PEZI|nr:hypothetical protein B0A49_12230 [Cryomyces minteri]
MSGLSSGNKAPQTLPEWLATPDDAAVKPDTRPKRQHTALQDSGPDKHQDTKRQRLDQAPTAAVKAATPVANKTPPMSDPVQVREASNRLEDRLDSIRDDLRAHQDEHSSLKSKASDAQKHLAERDVKINSLEGQLLDLQKKLETSVHECKNEKRAAKSDRLEVIKLRYQASTAKNKSDADNAKITKLEEQLAAITKKHDTIRNALTRLLQEVDSDD